MTLKPSHRCGGWPWAKSSGWRSVRSTSGSPPLWELLRAGKLRGLPYLRLARTYRFDLPIVDDWVKQQAANGATGTTRLRQGFLPKSTGEVGASPLVHS